jgi:cGMP-dependent protein kinase
MNDEELVETLASFSLFADLSREQIEAVAHMFTEQWFTVDQRILRQGFSGSGFYVILEGEAAVMIDGDERARLRRGDFFGEASVVLDEAPIADVTAVTPLRCLVLPRGELHEWLTGTPAVTYRMLQTELRRLRSANRWRT